MAQAVTRIADLVPAPRPGTCPLRRFRMMRPVTTRSRRAGLVRVQPRAAAGLAGGEGRDDEARCGTSGTTAAPAWLGAPPELSPARQARKESGRVRRLSPGRAARVEHGTAMAATVDAVMACTPTVPTSGTARRTWSVPRMRQVKW